MVVVPPGKSEFDRLKEAMPKPKSKAFARIRAEVIRLVGLIPAGKFTTYGSIGVHMNVMARHVAFVMSSLEMRQRQPRCLRQPRVACGALPWGLPKKCTQP